MVHRNTSRRSKVTTKTILRLPDLEQSKSAALHSLAAASSRESYRHAIDEFIGWYCSEPCLAFSRTVVLRYRFFFEQRNLAPSTINVRLAAVRRLAHEASDTGLLSSDLAAGIRPVKGAKRLGVLMSDGPDFRGLLAFLVIEGTPAANAGLKEGDKLRAIDGQPTAHMSLAQVRELLKRELGLHRLTVDRGSRRLTVVVTCHPLV